MADYDYDMLVIGSGPAGQRAAIQAAKLDKRVAIVERNETVGGAAVNATARRSGRPCCTYQGTASGGCTV